MKDWESVLRAVLQKYHFEPTFSLLKLPRLKVVKRGGKVIRLVPVRTILRIRRVYLGEPYRHVYFTKRETQTMLLLLLGQSVAEAAVVMQLSPQTIEYYLANMKAKLYARTLAELKSKTLRSNFLRNLCLDWQTTV